MNKGVLYGVCAYLAWGFLPIYWKALHTVTALQILSHRIVWSFVLLAVNWLTYIWGVNAGTIVETSLGYFINP